MRGGRGGFLIFRLRVSLSGMVQPRIFWIIGGMSEIPVTFVSSCPNIKPPTDRLRRVPRSRIACCFTLALLLLAFQPLPLGAAVSNRLSSSSPVSPDHGAPADQTYWAFKPVKFPTIPAPPAHARNPIDRFVFAQLAAKHLTPSPEASRRDLVRRLYFDVIGLPPTPEEALAFENDPARDAVEKLVDRLLASPRYGERWARHWLDVVRFAESHGFEMNQPRENAWPYRDYVIRAFNGDKPYNRFIVEQLAGDAFGVDEATGFLVGGPWDQVKSPDVVLTRNQRADELHDIVSTTGSAFLGLTVGCARCHDHKFDPIPQTDYYAIKACFAGVQHGDRPLIRPDSDPRQREETLCRARLSELDALLARFEPLAAVADEAHPTPSSTNGVLRPPVHPRRNVDRVAPVPAKRLRFTITRTSEAEPCLDELEVYSAGEKPENVALAAGGTKARASGVYVGSDFHKLEHINDGKHGNGRSWISNQRGRGWVELEFPEIVTIERIVWGRDREEKYADRLATEYRIDVTTNGGSASPAAAPESTPGPGWRLIASSADRQPYVPGRKPQPPYYLTGADASEEARKLFLEHTQQEARLKELITVGTVYAGKLTKPEPTFRFHRGDPMQTREEVAPGSLATLPVRFEIGGDPIPDSASQRRSTASPQATEDRRRRLALATWIASPANPLTPRVIVNRLWQYHFGEGLVSTPSDFGVNGARPTHPELLDWLAAELLEPSADAGLPVAQPWSLKHIQRLILTSAAYRQSSHSRSEALAVDAASRLLWRFPPRRLEAEALRDTVLAISGKLDLKMGGPGFSLFEPNSNYVRVYEPKRQSGPEDWRRMIYATSIRQRPDGVFGVFDCPDGGQIAPKRSRSTTPLQALNLLNSGFMMQQAGFFAVRLEREAGNEPAAQAQRAFALAFQRKADARELAAAVKMVREEGLIPLCRAIFNANEFVYLY